jgi:hypothetical protein
MHTPLPEAFPPHQTVCSQAVHALTISISIAHIVHDNVPVLLHNDLWVLGVAILTGMLVMTLKSVKLGQCKEHKIKTFALKINVKNIKQNLHLEDFHIKQHVYEQFDTPQVIGHGKDGAGNGPE